MITLQDFMRRTFRTEDDYTIQTHLEEDIYVLNLVFLCFELLVVLHRLQIHLPDSCWDGGATWTHLTQAQFKSRDMITQLIYDCS